MDVRIEPVPAGELKGGVKPGQEFEFGKAFSDR